MKPSRRPPRSLSAPLLACLLAGAGPSTAVLAPAAATAIWSSAALGATPPVDKHLRLRKLQKINRAFQVCYGRSLKRSESTEVLELTEAQLIQKFIVSDELAQVYAERLSDFSSKGDSVAHEEVSGSLKALAQPTRKLDMVLGGIDRVRHKGEQCGDKSNSVCFATWLVGRVAPSLGLTWIKEREAALPGWTYARLLEEIAKSSINQ